MSDIVDVAFFVGIGLLAYGVGGAVWAGLMLTTTALAVSVALAGGEDE